MEQEGKISKRDVYERLWKGHDFEIEHLWQRSVFLGAFLVLFFTAYCTLFGSLFSQFKDFKDTQSTVVISSTPIGSNIAVSEKESPKQVDFIGFMRQNKGANCGLFAIIILGACFSYLWIFMAKGSKYWYEKYESSIDQMQEDEGLFDETINNEWRKEEVQAMLDYREPKYMPIQGHLAKKDSNDSVFSHKGGAYSLSKVNVIVGQVFAVFWLVAMWLDIFVFSPENVVCLLTSLLFVLLIHSFLILLLGSTCRSSEAKWHTITQVFCCSNDSKRSAICKKKTEDKNILSIIEKECLRPDLIKTIPEEYSKKKDKWIVKHRDADKLTYPVHTFLEEKYFADLFQQIFSGEWKNENRAKISFPLDDDQLKELLKIIKPSYDENNNERDLKYGLFADILWKQLQNGDFSSSSNEYFIQSIDHWTLYIVFYTGVNEIVDCVRFDYSKHDKISTMDSTFSDSNGKIIGKSRWYR